MAVAIFTPRPNSQDFQERTIQLSETVKIGRSVAKVKSAANNLIFDCKVLSRNHAIVWYEGCKFFLQDTKSSNGTFINNVRLSKGAEESDPKELFSGDIVQFGVEVVENSKRGPVTHGCVIATLTLFGPDGGEASRVPASPGVGTAHSYELWQLSQYIQDALHREQIMENKIVTLQRIIADAQTTTGETFESIIQEDKLLTRLETLENHLDIVTRNCSEDELKQEITRLHEDKNKYEMAAKEGLRRVTEEKLKAIEKITQLEKSYSNAEDECSHYQTLYEKAQEELEDLAAKHRQRLEEMKSLRDQLEKSERRHVALDEQMNKERESTNEKLNIASKKELEYESRLESLQAECDFRKEQLVAMRAQMDKRQEEASKKKVRQNHEQNDDKETGGDLSLVEETIQVLKEKLQRLQDEAKTKQETVNEVKAKLDTYKNGEVADDTELPSLKNELLNSEQDLKYIREKAKEIEEQLLCCHLKAVDDLNDSDHSNSIIVNKDKDEHLSNHMLYSEPGTNYDVDMLDDLEAELQNIKNQLCRHGGKADHEELPLGLSDDNEGRRSEMILLKCMRHIQFIKDEMSNYKELVSSRSYTITALTDGQADSGGETIAELRDQLRTAESKAAEVKQEILTLRDKLLEEQETARAREEAIAQLHRQVKELTQSRKLSELEKTTEHLVAESAKSTAKHMQKQAALSAEKASKNQVQLKTLEEENKFLLQRVQTMESELKWSKKEKKRLTSEREKCDSNIQFNHKNSSTDVFSIQESQGIMQNNVENLTQNNDSAKRIDVLDEQNSRLKYFLLPVFFILLAILVSFVFGIIGSTPSAGMETSEM